MLNMLTVQAVKIALGNDRFHLSGGGAILTNGVQFMFNLINSRAQKIKM